MCIRDRILTEAAANGRVDKLVGLKENVIIGKLIPARYLDDAQVEELEAAARAEEEDEAMRLLASLGMEAQNGEEGATPWFMPGEAAGDMGEEEGPEADLTEDEEEEPEQGLAGDDIDAIHYPEVDLGNLEEENTDVNTVPAHHDHRDELFPEEEPAGEDEDKE